MQYKKNTTRQRLLACAVDEFYQKKKNASMSTIANKAQIAVGNIYNYYENKEALFLAAIEPIETKMDELFKIICYNCPAKKIIEILNETIFPYLVEHRKEVVLMVGYASVKDMDIKNQYYDSVGIEVKKSLDVICVKKGKKLCSTQFSRAVGRCFLSGVFDIVVNTSEEDGAIEVLDRFANFFITHLSRRL